MSAAKLEMFVIYERPRDFPEGYVMRRWVIGEGGDSSATDEMATAPTLAEIRVFVPSYCVRLERDPKDEPQIVEVWL
jgi:hypothetical protein